MSNQLDCQTQLEDLIEIINVCESAAKKLYDEMIDSDRRGISTRDLQEWWFGARSKLDITRISASSILGGESLTTDEIQFRLKSVILYFDEAQKYFKEGSDYIRRRSESSLFNHFSELSAVEYDRITSNLHSAQDLIHKIVESVSPELDYSALIRSVKFALESANNPNLDSDVLGDDVRRALELVASSQNVESVRGVISPIDECFNRLSVGKLESILDKLDETLRAVSDVQWHCEYTLNYEDHLDTEQLESLRDRVEAMFDVYNFLDAVKREAISLLS